jgi:oligopeptide transport system permease protein
MANQSVLVGSSPAEPALELKARGLWSDAFRRLAKNRLALAGLVAVALLAAVAFFPGVRRYDPYNDQDRANTYVGPSADHYLGTDNLGRDNWSRVVTGTRISLQVGVLTQSVVLIIGLAVGSAAALGGRFVDNLMMRFTDIAYAFPDLLLIILLQSVFGRGLWQVILAISLVAWTTIARIVRGQMLSLRERDFVLAARALGAPQLQIVTRHLLPNTLGPVIVAVTFGIPTAIFAEAVLTFIGLGLQLPTASLGRLVADGRDLVETNAWIVAAPAVVISLLMLSFTFLGDGLRDALDPRTRGLR